MAQRRVSGTHRMSKELTAIAGEKQKTTLDQRLNSDGMKDAESRVVYKHLIEGPRNE
jgi:hypothetical protein